MSKVYFLFGIHNHQPVGNDQFVFNDAFEKCYGPFLNVLKEFPEIKCNVNISGPLYDWILKNRPGYIKDLKEMSDKKQIEIISGGYYEPVLSIISDKDKKSQLKVMNNFIKREFNKIPKGMWLAERVWEPHLPRVINNCNLEYTFLDNFHFQYAGFDNGETLGYYSTEDSGARLDIFANSHTLRYLVKTQPGKYKGRYKIVKKVSYTIERR